jgi:hypothetical protein
LGEQLSDASRAGVIFKPQGIVRTELICFALRCGG